MKPYKEIAGDSLRDRDAVRRQQGQLKATIQHVQSISVAFEPGEEMMFVNSKSPSWAAERTEQKLGWQTAKRGAKNFAH